MKKKNLRFFKKIKRFFTDKNNKVVKSRKMFYGVLFSAVAIVSAVVILLAATGGPESAIKSADYRSTVINNGVTTQSATIHDLLEDLDGVNYTMSIVEFSTKSNKEVGNFDYIHTVTDDSVTCVLNDKKLNITYKSVKIDGKTDYSYESEDYKPVEDEVVFNVSSRAPSFIFHNYFHQGALSYFKYQGRNFAVSNSSTKDNIYICTNKGSTKIIYCETTSGTLKTTYTFKY